jgi:cytochrome P450
MDVTDEQAKEFIGLKTKNAAYSGLPPRTTCCPFFKAISGINGFNKKREAKVAEFKDAIQAKFPNDAWDADKLAIVGNTFCDSMLFAGGLSVPNLLVTMLALWFMEDRPAELDALNLLDEASLRNFMLETTRRYAPVAGVGRYITDDDGKTWEHQICNLRMVNRDPRVFPEPMRFRPGRPGLNHRDMSLSSAWADAAIVNNDVCHPDSHSCPGKHLSMEIIVAFMQELFAAGPWEAEDPSKLKVTDLKASAVKLTKVR